MITENDAQLFQSTKPYAELASSSQWAKVEADIIADLEKIVLNLSYVGFSGTGEDEHDILVKARAVRNLLKEVRSQAGKHERLRERIAKEGEISLPELKPLAPSA